MRYPLDKIRITQYWGENPDIYKRFGLKGHNGIDFGCVNGTPIYTPHNGIIKERSFDPEGYGNYLKIESNIEGSVLAHLKEFAVNVNKIVKEGDLVGYADNTGFSTGPHLHWGYYKIPRNRNDGYLGYINQLPLLEGVNMPDEFMQISIKDFEKIRNNSEKWDKVVSYLELTTDPALTPYDDVMNKIKGYKARETELTGKMKELEAVKLNLTEQVGRLKTGLIEVQTLNSNLLDEQKKIEISYQKQLGLLQARIGDLQGQIDQMGKDKGKLNEKIKELEAQVGYTSLIEFKPLKLALVKFI